MTIKEVLLELESFGNEKMRMQNTKKGARDNQFGVKLGDIRKLAKKIKVNHKLGIDLWNTENIDARLLSTLIVKPKDLSANEIDKMVRSVKFVQVADWLNAYVVKNHPESEDLRKEWMNDKDPMAARAGWNLTAQRVVKNPETLNFKEILNRIESEMEHADSNVQWTMNNTLAEIGINKPEHRERAINIGEKLGIYRDYPVSKGCTSPFAPVWIKEMVSRQS